MVLGPPLPVDFVSHAFGRAAERAKLEDVGLHDCRHTHAIRLRRAGVDLYTVKELLRHASARMAERYQHVTRDDLRAAVEAGRPRKRHQNRHQTAGRPAKSLILNRLGA